MLVPILGLFIGLWDLVGRPSQEDPEGLIKLESHLDPSGVSGDDVAAPCHVWEVAPGSFTKLFYVGLEALVSLIVG